MSPELPTRTWRFNAFDTWFFRESRPMDAIGVSELASLFPPPAATLAGAIRTAIGDHYRVDWRYFKDDPKYAELRRQIGDSAGLGQMTLSGPWLARHVGGQWQRLYPAPLNLMAAMPDGRPVRVYRLPLGPPSRCDLGSPRNDAGPGVRLPIDLGRDVKSLSDYWISGPTLNRVIAGETPRLDELIPEKDLFRREPRLGIARDNARRTVAEGMLYQTAHIRPGSDLACEIDVSGLSAELTPALGTIRLGGEGRAARFEVQDAAASEFVATGAAGTRGLILYLLTPLAVADPDNPMPLPGFEVSHDTVLGTRWLGEIGGVALTVHGAILGRCLRQGGWDLIKRAPRPVRSLVPPGSLFYATLEHGDLGNAMAAISKTAIGPEAERAFGRGRLVAGIWPATESRDAIATGTP